MAGRGSRLRPQTFITPKPLVNVAGKPILEQLLNDLMKLIEEPVQEIVFIIGPPIIFDNNIVNQLKKLAKKYKSKPTICRQLKPLGTGDAVLCAKDHLNGKAFVIYPDTLVRFNNKFDKSADVIIWTKKVKNPREYGVVKLDNRDQIVDLIEHPQKFVSDLAVIGIYYFKKIQILKDQLEKALELKKNTDREFYINVGILKLIEIGLKIKPCKVSAWLDCGNVKKAIEANNKMLSFHKNDNTKMISDKNKLINSKIIEPCYIGDNTIIENSTIGPFVSLGNDTRIIDSEIRNSIVQSNSEIINARIKNSMIGRFCKYNGKSNQINIGDYSELT